MAYKMYFYQTARGEREVRKFLCALPLKHCAKCIDYLNRVREQGTQLPGNIVKHLENGLWEARPEYGGIEYRFFFFVYNSHKIGVVSAIVKKRQRIERNVIERALRRAEEMRQQWQERDNEQARGVQHDQTTD